MGTYYNKLKKLVDSGRLSVYVVIAPPRSNSTLIEHLLNKSPDIQYVCHEPFATRKIGFEVDAENGYQKIFDSIGGQAFEDSSAKATVVIKEMAHWLGINKEYENFLTLTSNPVVLLIRNPLLAVESRIRRTIRSFSIWTNRSLKILLADVLMHDEDFKSEAEQLSSSEDKVRSILSRKEFNSINSEEIYSVPNIHVQNGILDYYAKKKGYNNWHDLIENKLYYEHDYKFFEMFLQLNKNRLKFESTEFQNLYEIAQFLKQTNRQSVILDTTDVRADPEYQLKELCLKLRISFSPEMIKWGQGNVNINTNQNDPHQKVWYDELFNSSGIKPPTEIPPTLEMFPGFMQKLFIIDKLPFYMLLSKQKNLSDKDRERISKRKFRIWVDKDNEDYLLSLGVITHKKNKKRHVDVRLCDIDPCTCPYQ